MKNDKNIILIFFGLLVFINPRIFLRTFIPDSSVASIIGVLMMIILTYFVIKNVNPKRIDKYTIYFSGFIILLWIKYISVGVPITVIIQDVPTFIALIAIIRFIRDTPFIKNVFIVFSIVMIINVAAIYSPTSLILEGFDKNTGYGYSSFLNNRATGFTIAPGVLSLFSSVGLVMGLIVFSQERKIIWFLLIISSLGCGVASGNRTFIIGLLVATILVPFLIKSNKVKLLYISIVALAAMLIISPSNLLDDYKYNMSERFSQNELQNAIDVRYTGGSGLLPVLRSAMKHPFFGSIHYDTYKQEIYILDENYRATTSNGLAAMFASMGIMYVSIYIFWTAIAFYRLIRWYRTTNSIFGKTWALAITIGYFTGHLICIFDGLLLNVLMMIFMSIGVKGGFAPNIIAEANNER